VKEDFPRKPFYTIGEVSRLTGVNTHVLRYWETQGKLLKPSRRRSRHRLYRAADIQLIFEIKRLRDEEKLTLAAMRRQLNPQTPRLPAPAPFLPRSPESSLAALLRDLKEELQALKALLD
jgi:DNA-binding transcriptional MerR regulator